MKALVTGSSGFVGSAFMRQLGEDGYEVWGCDIHHGDDVRDLFRNARNSCEFDLVVHCAAVVGGRAMIDGSPLHLACEDVTIDGEMWRWALRTRPKRIVYFSSSAVYPPPMQTCDAYMGLVESDYRFGQCDATYGMVKQVGERLAAEANDAGIPVHVFRPFSGYGEHQALDYPFPAFVRRAVAHEVPFEVWGRGDSARDWVHIDDIVGAVMAAVDQDVRGPVNICTGRATTFDELARMMMRRVGHAAPIRYLDDAPQGVHWRVGDPTKLNEFYVPRITLEEGIARALAAAA